MAMALVTPIEFDGISRQKPSHDRADRRKPRAQQQMKNDWGLTPMQTTGTRNRQYLPISPLSSLTRGEGLINPVRNDSVGQACTPIYQVVLHENQTSSNGETPWTGLRFRQVTQVRVLSKDVWTPRRNLFASGHWHRAPGRSGAFR